MNRKIVLALASIPLFTLVACSGSASQGNAASGQTAGTTATCKITGRIEDAVQYTVTIKSPTTAEITNVDVEFLASGAPLATDDGNNSLTSDGGIGILLSKAGASLPAMVSSGHNWTYVQNPASGSVFVTDESVGTPGFPAMPTSCKVIAVATTADPGNF